ncbi:MAG: metallophosphoesterase [Alphaproteobacteria bacterium]|nr:metallophosphoesterase [Alphaproteobacteria bacterium]MBU1515377.1 metallophosphoesterase [Alphaproteobacteria bacterium]MBU2092988.1 metallophosphoesterase [Alphaproteobacteria bacterium]MBU2150108.1 metallophosphoesterase [Alphaproteobacteria bacterium]MBU2309933.1 metallophosphoesterase [Alphaproteobacteria bacterium]
MGLQTVDRRLVLQGLAGAAAAASAPAWADEPAPAFVAPAFVALGDWGRDGDRNQSDVARAMAQAAAEVRSRFVVSVGDNFYPAGVQSPDDPQWKTSFEDVYAAPSLQTPWYVALGNHDYRGRPGAQLAYARRDNRWRMPERSYVVAASESGVANLDIFVLDTTPMVGDYDEALMRLVRGRVSVPNPGRQYAWLQRALQRSRAAWKVVVGHHPIYSGGRHGGSPELAARLEPLFQAHGVQAYLCGHDHSLQHIQVGGTAHVCTGAGASAGPAEDVAGTRFRASLPGFAVFAVAEQALRLEFRDFNGRSLYRTAIPKAGG